MNQSYPPPSPLLRPPGPGQRAFIDFGRLASDATPRVLALWRQLMLRKWLIVGIALLVAIATAAYVWRLTPIYRSVATVLIEQSKSKVVSIEEVYTGISSNREYFLTQAEFFRSRDVAMRVVDKLNLSEHPEFDPRQQPESWSDNLRERVMSIVRGPTADLSQDKSEAGQALFKRRLEARVVGAFHSRMSVQPQRLSQLVRVGFESADPEFAAKVANAIAAAYIQSDLDARFSMTAQANVWLNERLAKLKKQLDQSEQALQAYRERTGIVSSKNNQSMGGSARQLEDFAQKLVDARVRRQQAEQAYRQVSSRNTDRYQVPAVLSNPAVIAARQAEATAEQKFSDIRQRYGPAFPTYKQAQKEYELAKSNTRRQGDAVIASIRKEYEAARALEASLEKSLESARGSIRAINRKEIEATALESDVASNKQLYETFLARVKETNAAADILTPNARVVDAAVPSIVPIKPAKTKLVILAAIFGLAGGAVLALFLGRIDNTVQSTDGIEQRFGVSMLTATPSLRRRDGLPERMVLDHPSTVYSESIRTLQTSLLLSTVESGGSRRIVITSSLAGEGKSTVAMNLANSLAESKRVVLVDCDLRKPVVALRCGLGEGTPGLADAVAGTPLDNCLHEATEGKLTILPAGNLDRNPLEIQFSDGFRTLLDELDERFDVIIIDAPPVHLVSDAMIIGQQCTGLVFVVRAGRTPSPVVKGSLQRLQNVNVNVLGLVINGLDFKRAERYYGDHGSYGSESYGYGYGYGGGPRKG